MKHAALRGLVVGLVWSAGVLAIRPAFLLGVWIAHLIDPHVFILDVR